ncbi:MAG TPA: DUF305 domain-containing protein [Opitutaceae bacterium]
MTFTSKKFFGVALFLCCPLLGLATGEALLCASDGANNTGPARDFYRAMDASMMTMHQQMEAVAATGDIDRDFAAMMLPHHEAAIEMARAVLLHGKDPLIHRLAQEIVTDQSVEIAVMQRFLAGAAPGASAAGVGGSGVPAATTGAADKPAPAAISPGDRVYSADQVSNTVSVIDPVANRLLGVIRLGDPFPAALSPLYRGALLVHGLGYSPKHDTLAVVSIGSNSVTFIDTRTNRVQGVVYVGRSPHEAFFTPDGRELWVTVRGEDYIAVIDPVQMRETARIRTANGPGMVLFRPDGKYAFVPSSFTPELAVIDVQTRTVVARVKQASPFSPNLAVSPDGREVWFTLKDTGQVQVIDAAPPFRTRATLDIGPLCNHVALVDNARGQFAYVTVGGSNEVQVWSRGARPALVTRIPTGDLPHGIWPSGDGSRVYLTLENGDAVQAIDTLDNQVVATIGIGQLPQAIVYVPGAVPAGSGTDNLVPLGEAGVAAHLRLAPVADGEAPAQGGAVVNAVGQLQHVQVVASGLQRGREYQLWLAESAEAPFGQRWPLAKGKANPAGAVLLQALGPLREIAPVPAGAAEPAARRYLVLTEAEGDRPVLAQAR